MSVKIYCIEDINDVKYVGSTTMSLTRRLGRHRVNAVSCKSYCSSEKLNLYNCIIYELETCDKKDKASREKYWILNTDCVNQIKFETTDNENYWKEYYSKNKERRKRESREYYRMKKKKF
tara:strand:+ start:7373 stop:7732 length:360 start_codon:yes stop_codon:yes gene_type:complete